MTRKIFISVALSISCALLLAACGKKASESEQAYANTCVKVMAFGGSNEERWRKHCECEAALVVPKLAPGELKVYLASMDWPRGKAMSQADVAKFAADHGFTTEDKSSYEGKWRGLLPEVEKTCKEAK